MGDRLSGGCPFDIGCSHPRPGTVDANLSSDARLLPDLFVVFVFVSHLLNLVLVLPNDLSGLHTARLLFGADLLHAAGVLHHAELLLLPDLSWLSVLVLVLPLRGSKGIG